MSECIFKFSWYAVVEVVMRARAIVDKKGNWRALIYGFVNQKTMEIFAREDVDKVILIPWT